MPASNKLSVRVRMYRQGLGDCFLLTFQRKNKADFNLLIDCGLYQTAKDKAKTMKDVADDIKKTSNDNLDVVVLTHDHYDHTSGFTLAKDVFDTIDFKQVWVGWTEDKNHPKYKTIKDHFAIQAEGLRAALKLEQMQSEKLKPLRKTINSLVNDFFGVSETTLGAVKDDSRTWEYILKEKNAEIHPCSPGKLMTFEGLEDEVRVYVLGPPEDMDMILMENPPADKVEAESYRHLLGMALAESFLAAAGDETNIRLNSQSYMPFDESYKIEPKDAEAGAHDEFFKERYYGLEEKDKKDKFNWRQIDADWLMIAGELALRLDNGTNNSCLALAIELVKSKKVLVFPGDAQFGNWYSWKDLSWEITDQNGNKTKVMTKDLLERTVLYKVGHHGSHNSTLKTHGLRMMTSPELVAMIPTNRKFAKDKQGWEMPDKTLEIDLIKHTRGRVIPADEVGEDDRKKHLRERCEKLEENKLPKSKIESFLKQVNFDGTFSGDNPEPLYVEYTIKG
jgi:beta-lactamase superfamily II metal-dependent hydrolase